MLNKETIKRVLRKSDAIFSLAYILDDLRWKWRLSHGHIQCLSGTRDPSFTVKDAADYIESVVENYKRYGDIDAFSGNAIELGPGDSAGVAFLMRHDGCVSVELVDRYESKSNANTELSILAELCERHPSARALFESGEITTSIQGVHWTRGLSAESFFARAKDQNRRFDFIVSQAVLEHLSAPVECLEDMIKCLSNGGRALHTVDLRDHGFFTPHDHTLKFLELPSSVYRLMTQYSGRPNRILYHKYRESLERLQQSGLVDYMMYVTSLAGVGPISPHVPIADLAPTDIAKAEAFVDSHRERFAQEFRAVSSLELAIQGFFLKAVRKQN